MVYNQCFTLQQRVRTQLDLAVGEHGWVELDHLLHMIKAKGKLLKQK